MADCDEAAEINVTGRYGSQAQLQDWCSGRGLWVMMETLHIKSLPHCVDGLLTANVSYSLDIP